MNQMLEQMICARETAKSEAEERHQTELSQWKAEYEKTKAEEESLQKAIGETKQVLDQERQVHKETQQRLQGLEVSDSH